MNIGPYKRYSFQRLHWGHCNWCLKRHDGNGTTSPQWSTVLPLSLSPVPTSQNTRTVRKNHNESVAENYHRLQHSLHRWLLVDAATTRPRLWCCLRLAIGGIWLECVFASCVGKTRWILRSFWMRHRITQRSPQAHTFVEIWTCCFMTPGVYFRI